MVRWAVGAAPLRFWYREFFRATFPFFGQKSLSFHNLGSERKKLSNFRLTVFSVDSVLFVPISMSF